MKPTEVQSTGGIKAKVTREEQAALELGHTEFAKGTRETLVVFFLLVITSVPAIQFYAALQHPERVTRFISGLRGLAPDHDQIKAVDGAIGAINLLPTSSQIKAVEDDWEQNSVVGEELLPRVQSLLLTLGHGNEKALLGRDGWLFYRADVDYVTGRGFLESSVLKRRAAAGSNSKALQPDPVKAIVDFRDQLSARGIELIIMPTPAKPSIYPEHFSSGCTGRPVHNPSFDQFKSQLASAGVTVFDPAPMLTAQKTRTPSLPLYLKTDTHWTPAAMEQMAALLAVTVRGTVLLSPATQRFTTIEKQVQNMGDIAMMLKLPAEQRIFPRETVQIKQVMDGDILWRREASSEVLFLGDSFANIFSLEPMGWGEAAGFVEHLSLSLGLPVDAICRNDAGSHATREMLANELQRGNDRLTGKKIVIWEFAARELASGDWKMLSLALGDKKTAGFYTPKAGTTVEVRGVVRAVSSAPRPGSVPYKDHILMIHLGDIASAANDSIADKEAVVFAWSMRDNKAMPASQLRPGNAVRLHLQLWSDLSSKYEKINRSELDNENLLFANPAWAADVKQENQDGALDKQDDPKTGRDNSVANIADRSEIITPVVNATKNSSFAFRETCAKKAADGELMSIEGIDGWLFLRSELRHIGVGPFWGDAASKVSKATSPDKADPLPAIVDFHQQLKAMGIELIVAPVPCKALVYPEMLDAVPSERLDTIHQQFFKLLSDKGVKVLDLAEVFVKEKSIQGSPFLYCKTDSHWSPYACEVAAREITDVLGVPAWLKSNPDAFKTQRETRTIAGDLAGGNGPEQLPVRVVKYSGGETENKNSPVVLLGDSHTLVFHAGADLHGSGAGLCDQLAVALGIPIDVIAVRGSGATPARVNLMRRSKADPGYLAGKKIVIWCFAAREFTESTGWSVFKLNK